MIIRIFKFKWRRLRFLFKKRPTCKEGKAKVRFFKSYHSYYKHRHNIRETCLELLYVWPCECKRGDSLPYCHGIENVVICPPEINKSIPLMVKEAVKNEK